MSGPGSTILSRPIIVLTALSEIFTGRDYGFNRLGFDRLISVIQPGNRASQRVALKNGMHLEKETKVQDVPVHVYAIEKS